MNMLAYGNQRSKPFPQTSHTLALLLRIIICVEQSAMSKRWTWITASFVVLIAVVAAVSMLIAEPLRGLIERRLNANLRGYTARLGSVDFHLLGFSLDLNDLVIVQNTNPEPPVISIPQLSASVQWRALLAARLVADFTLDRPVLYMNRKQTQKEIEDKIAVQERGWQEALQSIYPLKINEFKINDGTVTYVDQGSFPPLQIKQLNLRADNIRNVWSPERVYPSALHVDGQVFDSGRLLLDGHANFLAEPQAALNVQLTLENIELNYFRPLLVRQNLTLRNGTLSGTGHMEYAPPHTQVIDLQNVTIQGVQLTYTHTKRSTVKEKEVVQKTVQTAQKVNNNPQVFLRAGQLDISKSTFAFENKEATPDYRLFFDNAEVHLSNFTNHSTEGNMVAKLAGKFMGTGPTTVGATFRPERSGPDFDLAVRIEPTPMRVLNDLWRAYGNFDVVGGLFSFYTELEVKNGEVSGYIKPLFKDIDAYDSRQDKNKGIFHNIYERLIGGMSWLLENTPRDEVATVTTVSGKLENPESSTSEAILGLIQNAFFKSILPGFEKTQGQPSTSDEANSDETSRTASEAVTTAKKRAKR
jgi:hypothetical protein